MMIKKQNLKLHFMTILFLFFLVVTYANHQVYANTKALNYTYTYEDYLSDKTYQEELEKRKRDKTISSAIITVLFIGGFLISIYAWHKRTVRIEKEKKAIEVCNRNLEIERRKKILAEIQKRYPHFTAEGLMNFFQIALIQLQKAIENKDFKKLELIETDEFYIAHCASISQLGTDKQCSRKQDVISLIPESFLTGAEDTIVVILEVSLISYLYDQIAMRIKSGSEQHLVTHHYRIELVHNKTKENIDYHHCMNCGAPIEMDEEGRCSYCHTLIQRTNVSWQVNKYEKI